MFLSIKPTAPAIVLSAIFLTACGGSGDAPITGKPDSGDSTAPVFTGITSAIPSGATNITVNWTAASDDVTAANNILYRIYASTDLVNKGSPVAFVTSATTYTLRYREIGREYKVSVEAVDESGNANDNSAAINTTTSNTVSFALDIQPVFAANCTNSSCHDSTAPEGGLILDSRNTSYNSIVDMPMSNCSGKFITPGSVDTSLMLSKLDWSKNICGGGRMPKAGTELPANFLRAMESWILADAPNNN